MVGTLRYAGRASPFRVADRAVVAGISQAFRDPSQQAFPALAGGVS